MKHTIDLQNYNLRTDLAIEKINNQSIKPINKIEKYKYKDITIETIKINKQDSKIIGRKVGLYTTITFDDVTDETNKNNLKYVLIKELKKYLRIKKEDLVLVIGLGNMLSTPDSLGPKVIDNITVTNHLYDMHLCLPNYQKVAAFAPSVTGKTGIETFDQIKSIVNILNPKVIIAIDSLASSSIEHLNRTIQITNTGINPGSGIGNLRKEISFDTLNVPVIAIGIPTVLDASSIVFDTLNYMIKNYSFAKKNKNNKKYLLTYNNVNYLKSDSDILKEDKELLLGMIGKLSSEELKILINEVLTPIGYNLMVTTKEIDFITKNIVEILSDSLNSFFSS